MCAFEKINDFKDGVKQLTLSDIKLMQGNTQVGELKLIEKMNDIMLSNLNAGPRETVQLDKIISSPGLRASIKKSQIVKMDVSDFSIETN